MTRPEMQPWAPPEEPERPSRFEDIGAIVAAALGVPVAIALWLLFLWAAYRLWVMLVEAVG
jgi:hypothetical protein